MIKMDRAKKNKINMIIVFIVLFSISHINGVYGVETNKNVLFISSYDQNFITVPEQIESIKSIFNLNKINLDIEYMDTKRFDTDENVSNFYKSIKYKMDNLRAYDAVIVGDDSALQFAIDNRESLFKNSPVVFLGINNINGVKLVKKYKNMTGLLIISFLIIVLTVLVIDNINCRAIEKALTDSNIKLSEVYDELAVSEEELKVQYDIIQENIDEIKKLNERYELAIESTNSAVWDINLNNNELYVSKNFVNIMGITDFELKDVNKLLKRVLSVDDRKLLLDQYKDYKNGVISEINLQLQFKNYIGSERWVLLISRGYSVTNQDSRVIHGIVLDITQMKEQKEKIEYLAHHDYLTNLPNRMQFANRLEEELSNEKFGSVLLLDIDNFKSINDTLGHAYGDEILKQISRRLKSIVNEHLFVSRFGGDEFLILLSNVEEVNDINVYVDQIINLFSNSFIIDNVDNYIQFSIGITRFPHDGENIHQLISNADTAMYKAKNSGKNISRIFSSDMKDELTSKAEVEYILRDALKNNGFTLFYQPQVDVETSQAVGFEALIRLNDYEIYPSKFINIAEENGLILEIGRWVTKEAIEQLVIWRDKGFELKPISINFSSKQLRDKGYIEFLSEILNNNNMEAKYIEVEITESILFEKTEKSLEFLNQLKNMGIKISLDDFGTGFSSLSYLTYIPVNKIKLDKSLCDKFLELNNVNVIDNLISLAHSLNLEVTAEGIERLEQYKRLRTVGCNYIQGYLFSEPICVEDIEKIYDSNLMEKLYL